MNKILVMATPYFREDQSSPDDNKFVWSFSLQVSNAGDKSIKLKDKSWTLVNQNGLVQSSKESGADIKVPIIHPGEAIEFSSGVRLNTPSGMIFGTYSVTDDDGSDFEIDIPAFSLDSPYFQPVLN